MGVTYLLNSVITTWAAQDISFNLSSWWDSVSAGNPNESMLRVTGDQLVPKHGSWGTLALLDLYLNVTDLEYAKLSLINDCSLTHTHTEKIWVSSAKSIKAFKDNCTGFGKNRFSGSLWHTFEWITSKLPSSFPHINDLCPQHWVIVAAITVVTHCCGLSSQLGRSIQFQRQEALFQ